MSKLSGSVRLATALLVTAVLLAGCWGRSTAQFVEDGKAAMEQKEFRAAAIEFKNALLQDSSNAEARFLLGKALVEMGNLPEAWVELSKAREVGYNNDELAPLMGSVLILRGDVDKFIAEYAGIELSTPKARAELNAALATAYGIKGRYQQSREAAEAALQADPNNLVAQLTVVQLLRVAGDKAGAIALIERIIQAHPQASQPWVSKAEELLASGAGPEAAIPAYREAIRLAPGNVLAHVGIIQQLMRQRDFDGAQRQLAQLEKAQPKSLQGLYYAAALAYEKRDLKAAFESAQQLLRFAPENPRYLQLAGMIDYERGSYLQAIAHLSKALPVSPAPVAVRVLLARAQLRAGDPTKALAYVQPLLDGGGPVPADVYSAAADCYLQLGDGGAAKQMYAKAVKLSPGDSRGRTVLALSALSEGRIEQAMTELKSVAGSSRGDEAEIVMIMANIRGSRFDDARAVIDSLEHKQPGTPVAPYFRAQIEQLQGQRGKARELYEQAVARGAAYAPAVAALAALDLEDGKPANAAARYEKLVAAAPASVSARMGLISARARAGAKADDLRAQLEEAVRLFPDAAQPRLALVAGLLQRNDAKAALQVANDAVVRFPDNAGLLQAQGLAELAAGNYNQATQVFTKAASLQPNSVEPLMHMADVQLARKDMRAAVAQLRKVLVMKPDHLPAQARLITLLARTGKIDEAMAVAKGIEAQAPGEANGWIFEGDLLAMKGNKTGAVAALKTAHVKRPSDETAIKLHNALMTAGQAAEAGKLAADWLAKRPGSPAFNFYLGDQAIASRDYEAAEQHYRKVLAAAPSNAVALNNLAWLLHRAGKPGAMEMGDKALALAPNEVSILDTVAEIQDGSGHPDKALALQKRAVEIDPEQPVHRLHLARYLIKNSQKAAARRELQRLAALGRNFDQQEEVQKLLSSL